MAIRLKSLTYADLTIEELRQSNIPDENLSSVGVVGVGPQKNYTLDFVVMYNHIRVSGKRKQISAERYEKNSSGLNKILDGVQKVVKGRREPFENQDFMDFDTCLIVKPEMKKTQSGIAETIGQIKDELKLRDAIIKEVFYLVVEPIDPSSDGLGFNLPSQKITKKEWL